MAACLTAPLASCLGSCLGTCACAALPKRPPARATYAVVFALSLVGTWVARDEGSKALSKFSWIGADGGASAAWFKTQAVYRASCATAMFFGVLAASLVGVKHRGDIRDMMIHRGSWTLKMMALALLQVGVFCLASDWSMEAYAAVARVGSGLFLVIQMIIVLDLAFTWNEAWASREHWGWIAGLLAATLAMIGGAAALFAEMYSSYAPSKSCHRNIAMITSTAVLCGVILLMTLHPMSREGCLLPSAAVTLYCAYLCYSALSSEPSSYSCRPQTFIDANEELRKPANAVTTAFTLGSVVYAAIRAGESNFWNMDPSDEVDASLAQALNDEEAASDDDDTDGDDVDDESARRRRPVKYSYSFFHLIFVLASMYTSMLLTGWGTRREDDTEAVGSGWASVWVKFFSVWATGAIYLWCLIAPALFPDREF